MNKKVENIKCGDIFICNGFKFIIANVSCNAPESISWGSAREYIKTNEIEVYYNIISLTSGERIMYHSITFEGIIKEIARLDKYFGVEFVEKH